MPDYEQELSKIYHRRFVRTAAYRNRVWEVLTRSFFSRWVRPDHTVLDLGCGYGEFINNITAASKSAMDPGSGRTSVSCTRTALLLGRYPPTRSTPFSRAIFSSIFLAKRISVSRCAMLSAVSNQAAVSWQSAPM